MLNLITHQLSSSPDHQFDKSWSTIFQADREKMAEILDEE